MVLKKYVDVNHDLQVEVLYALQISIAKLEHPPSKIRDVWTRTHTHTPLTACITLSD